MAIGSNIKAPKFTKNDLKTLGSDTSGPTVQDLLISPDQMAPVGNMPSNLNAAAHQAAISDTSGDAQKMIDTYRTIASEYGDLGQSRTAEYLSQQNKDRAIQQNAPGVMDALADPQVTDEAKLNIVRAAYDKSNVMYSDSNMLSAKALNTPTIKPQSQENEQNTFDSAAISAQINQRKQDMQKIYNAAVTKIQPDLTDKLVSFGMSLIPFSQTYMLAKIRSDSSGLPVKAFLQTLYQGVGSTQKELRDHINSLPDDQKLAAAQHMADIINTHSNILLSTPDDFARRDMLQNILGGQGYGHSEELTDNLLNWVGNVFDAGTAVSALKTAGKASAILRDKDAFSKAFEANYKNVSGRPYDVPEDSKYPAFQPEEPELLAKPSANNTTPGSMQKFYRSREVLVHDSGVSGTYRKLPNQTVLSSAIRDAIKSEIQPVSVYNNVKDMNVDMARNMYESANIDASGEAAQALTGASRADAVASPVLPELEHVDGSVQAKISAPDAISQMNNPVVDTFTNFANNDGMTQYLQSEKAAARSWKQQQFADATALNERGEMFQLINPKEATTDTPHGFTFRGVYGPAEGGFANHEEALALAKFALRNTGIDESKLSLLMRDGDRYVKVDPANLPSGEGEIKNDFLVSVDHDYAIKPADITEADGWEPLNVRLNYFDRHLIGSGESGKFNDYFIDKASQLPVHMIGPAVVNTDKASRIERDMLNEIGNIAKKWKKRDKNTQQLLLNEIQQANYQSRDYDFGRLAASGASAEDMDLLKQMKNYWDGIWDVKNKYFVKQLQKGGYHEFIEPTTNTSLPARAMKIKPKGSVSVYDPVSNAIKVLRPADVDALYQNGSGLAKLRWPHVEPSGDVAEYVAHGNNPNGGYLKAFGPHSQVLQYRKGYYPVEYTDAFHIVERVGDARGNVAYERSVATANTHQEADLMAGRMNSSSTNPPLADGNPQFYFRKDRNLNTEARFERELDVNQAQGHTNFRRRGKLLDDSTSNVATLASTHVRSPIETMIRQAIPLSNKVAMDDVIESMYQRAIAQWGDLLPKGKYGDPMIPTDLRQIRYRGVGNQNAKAVADARTVVGYANYLRNGYTNVLDDKIKGIMHAMADTLGKAGLGKVEVATRDFASKSLTNGLKSAAYYTSIGLAPLRQMVVQGHQAVMLAALNPQWLASSASHSQALYVAMRTLGIETTHPAIPTLAKAAWGNIRDAEEAMTQWKATGLGSAVDKQNMITGAVNDMAKNMINNSRSDAISKATFLPRAVLSASQKLGFETGEFYSNLMSWLAHRDLAKRSGIDVSKADEVDKFTAASRNYTGNMNSAGDMPGNRNALAFILQFTQNTQKMLLNLTTNRAIPWQVKAKFGAIAVALFGIPDLVFYNTPLNNIQDSNARELVHYGLTSFTLNKMMSLMTGQDAQIDWRSLNPLGFDGLLQLTHNIFTGSLGSIVTSSPGMSLVAGNNPRVANFFTDVAKYVNLTDDHTNPVTFHQVAMDFAKIASGMSAAFKAKYLLEYRKKVSSTGTITQDDVDRINAVGAALGMPTEYESDVNWLNQDMYNSKKQVQDNFNKWWPEAQRIYSDDNVKGNELAYQQKMLTEFFRVYGNGHPDLTRLMNEKLVQQMQHGDAAMYNNILRNCTLTSGGDCRKLINAAPFKDEQERQHLLELINATEQIKPQ